MDTVTKTKTATRTTGVAATAMDTAMVMSVTPTMIEISATGTALTTIICLRVWPHAIISLPD